MQKNSEHSTVKNDLSPSSPTWADMMTAFNKLNLSHSLCVSAVRVLRRAGEAKTPDPELNGIANYFTNLFLKTPGIGASLKLLHDVPGARPLNKDIAKTYSPYEWAHIFSTYFLSKKLTTLCPSPQLRPSFESVYESADLAYRLWIAIPSLPLCDWLLAGAIRPLSLLIFALIDEQKFVAHRRALRTIGRDIYNFEKERELFGIDHSIFCSFLCQQLGFGAERGEDIKKAVDMRFRHETLSPQALQLRVATHWITALLNTQKAPESHIPAKFYPAEHDFKKLVDHVALLRNEGAVASWLDPANQLSPQKDDSTEVLEAEIPESALKHMAKDIDTETEI